MATLYSIKELSRNSFRVFSLGTRRVLYLCSPRPASGRGAGGGLTHRREYKAFWLFGRRVSEAQKSQPVA